MYLRMAIKLRTGVYRSIRSKMGSGSSLGSGTAMITQEDVIKACAFLIVISGIIIAVIEIGGR